MIISHNDNNVDSYNPAVVGVVYDLGNADFHISARSTDLKEGRAGFSWAAFLELPAPYVCQTKVRASTSVVPAKTFSHDGFGGVWQSTGVRFPDSFDTAPVILATASNLNAYVHKTAAVNMVSGITKDGFVMAARNSDCQGGSCGFGYLALAFVAVAESKLYLGTGWVSQKKFEKDCDPGD